MSSLEESLTLSLAEKLSSRRMTGSRSVRRQHVDALIDECALAVRDGEDFLGCSSGDMAEALQHVANVMGIPGPYARLSLLSRQEKTSGVPRG